MKTLPLVAALAVSFLAAQFACAQTTDSTTTKKSTTVNKHKTSSSVAASDNAKLTERLRRIERESRQLTPEKPVSRIDGSVTRAARSGNPLQMVNPLVPKEYGDGSDVTRRESDDPYQRPQGLRLFAWTF